MKHKRSITITAMSRPQLFRRMLESLITNDLSGWSILIRVEPTARSPDFVAIAAELLAGVDYDLRVNETVLGISMNPYQAIEDAFAAGSQLNLYVEEDFLLSPDATALALWYQRQHRRHWLCLSLLAGPCGSAGLLSNAEHPELLFEARTFNSIGFVMRRAEWQNYARRAWLGAEPQSPVIHATWRYAWGWDWSLYGLVAAGFGLRTVQPVLARATHNGRDGGTYASPEFHDAAFGKLPVNMQSAIDYRLVAISDLPQDVRAHAVLQDEITTMRMHMEDVALGYTERLTTALGSGLPQPDAPPAPSSEGLFQRLRRR
jgi:hypothetical protein